MLPSLSRARKRAALPCPRPLGINAPVPICPVTRLRGGSSGRLRPEEGVQMATEVEAPQFGGTVETVLSSSRIEPAPATLEEARNAPGRDDKIEALTRRIEAEG